METIQSLLEAQVRRHIGLSPEALEHARHPSPSDLHDPFLYKDMDRLVLYLHQIKKDQEQNPKNLLVIVGDYDTDGVCAAAVLTASLEVFGFQFRTYIPSMADGYGLSQTSVRKIQRQFERDGYRVTAILTADNGASAYNGIAYARSLGIAVLVTDHHPVSDVLPDANVLVDAWRPDCQYPFKGNSGATVAWKAMLAYAERCAKDKKPLIERLIIFAGISNVADVMPLTDENRYMVVAALKAIKELRKKKQWEDVANTPYPFYNAVFHGLVHVLYAMQVEKDEKRKASGKNAIPLPEHEELFGWYLSPLLNAPRRVHDTCLESLAAFLVTEKEVREPIIHRLLELNKKKSKLRDTVLSALKGRPAPILLCVNTKKGISGLIAGKLAEQTGLPSIVLSREDPENSDPLYRADTRPKTGRLSGSGRSNDPYPLNRILEMVEESHPGLIQGGGHAGAAGISIRAEDFERVEEAIRGVLPAIYQESIKNRILCPENVVNIRITKDGMFGGYQTVEEGAYQTHWVPLNGRTFASDIKEAYAFIQSLRPFGEGYMEEPKIRILFDQSISAHNWNPDFWKTFKFQIFDVEVLTFDETWAKNVKEALKTGTVVSGIGTIRENTFRGVTTMQIQLSPE